MGPCLQVSTMVCSQVDFLGFIINGSTHTYKQLAHKSQIITFIHTLIVHTHTRLVSIGANIKQLTELGGSNNICECRRCSIHWVLPAVSFLIQIPTSAVSCISALNYILSEIGIALTCCGIQYVRGLGNGLKTMEQHHWWNIYVFIPPLQALINGLTWDQSTFIWFVRLGSLCVSNWVELDLICFRKGNGCFLFCDPHKNSIKWVRHFLPFTNPQWILLMHSSLSECSHISSRRSSKNSFLMHISAHEDIGRLNEWARSQPLEYNAKTWGWLKMCKLFCKWWEVRKCLCFKMSFPLKS